MLELPTRVIVIMILEILAYVAGDDKITQRGGVVFLRSNRKYYLSIYIMCMLRAGH